MHAGKSLASISVTIPYRPYQYRHNIRSALQYSFGARRQLAGAQLNSLNSGECVAFGSHCLHACREVIGLNIRSSLRYGFGALVVSWLGRS